MALSPIESWIRPQDEQFSLVQGTTQRITVSDLLGDDQGLGGAVLSLQSVGQPAHGSLVLQSDGSYLYTPAVGYVGPDTFSYVVADQFGNTCTEGVEVTVTASAPNQAPEVQDETVQARAGVPISGHESLLLANDRDPEGSPLQITSYGQPAHGTLTRAADGTLTYTAQSNYSGSDSFTYTVADADGKTSVGTVTVQVAAAMVTPSIHSAQDNQGANQGAIAAGGSTDDTTPTFSGTAEAGATITLYDGTTAVGSTVADASGNWSLTPSPALSEGAHSLQVKAQASDGAQAVSPSFGLSIQPDTAPNHAPQVQDEWATVYAGEPISAHESVLLANDTDADGDSLSVATLGKPQHGTLTRSSDGTLTYTADAGYSGDDSFTYQVSDGHGGTTQGTVHLSVQVRDNRAPVVQDEVASLRAGSTVSAHESILLANDSDPDGDALSLVPTGYSKPAHGSLNRASDGTLTYAADAGYVGDDSFTYTVVDAQGKTSTGTVTLQVTQGMQAPQITSVVDHVGAQQGPVAKDGSTDDSAPTLSGTAEAGAVVSLYDGNTPLGTTVADSSGHWSLTPTSPLSQGLHQLEVRALASDGAQARSSSFGITIAPDAPPPNKAPVVVSEQASVIAGNAFKTTEAALLANDSDPEGGALSIQPTGYGQPAHGSLSRAADGSLTYTPNAGYVGQDSFTYTVVDAQGATSQGTVRLEVGADLRTGALRIQDDAGSIRGDLAAGSVTDDTTPTLSGTAGAGTSSVAVYDGATLLGQAAVNADGSWQFTSPALKDGVHQLSTQAIGSKGELGTASAPVSLTVDTQGPTIAIQPSAGGAVSGKPLDISFKLSEASADFTAADVKVSGGTLSNFRGAGDSYTATFTADGSSSKAAISVDTARFADQAGNTNAQAVSQDLSVSYAKSVSITGAQVSEAPAGGVGYSLETFSATNLPPATTGSPVYSSMDTAAWHINYLNPGQMGIWWTTPGYYGITSMALGINAANQQQGTYGFTTEFISKQGAFDQVSFRYYDAQISYVNSNSFGTVNYYDASNNFLGSDNLINAALADPYGRLGYFSGSSLAKGATRMTITTFGDYWAMDDLNVHLTATQRNIGTGGSTSDTTPTLSGNLSAPLEAGETVGIYRDGLFIGNASIGTGSSQWTWTDTGTSVGKHSYEAHLVAGGNTLGLSSNFDVNVASSSAGLLSSVSRATAASASAGDGEHTVQASLAQAAPTDSYLSTWEEPSPALASTTPLAPPLALDAQPVLSLDLVPAATATPTSVTAEAAQAPEALLAQDLLPAHSPLDFGHGLASYQGRELPMLVDDGSAASAALPQATAHALEHPLLNADLSMAVHHLRTELTEHGMA